MLEMLRMHISLEKYHKISLQLKTCVFFLRIYLIISSQRLRVTRCAASKEHI